MNQIPFINSLAVIINRNAAATYIQHIILTLKQFVLKQIATNYSVRWISTIICRVKRNIA